MAFKSLLLIALLVSASVAAAAQKLDEIPSTRFRVSTQKIRLVRLSDVEVHSIAATKALAILNGGRVLMTLAAGDSALQVYRPEILPEGANWFGPICTMGSAFVLGVHNYPEERENQNSETPRGGYRVGPSSLGFFLLTATGNTRYVEKLRIAGRRQATLPGGVSETGDSLFSDAVQSCAWNGKALVIGSYGSLGRVDFDNGAVDVLDEDDGVAFSRHPLLVENKGIWVALDEGGLGGAFISMRSELGNLRIFGIDNDYDVVSYNAIVRHRGSLFVGTSHGLFRLDEKTGHFNRLDVGEKLSGEAVTDLVNYRKRLWAFIGGDWLGINLQDRTAVRYLNSTPIKLTTGVHFDGAWLLAGQDGVWSSRRSKKK